MRKTRHKHAILVCLRLLPFLLKITSSAPVTTSDLIPECDYLPVKDGQKANSFIGEYGRRCCMCQIGAYVADDCNETEPNSTRCEPCRYDDKVKTYIDYGPHDQRECMLDDSTTCMEHQVYIPGSRFSRHQCKCPEGEREINHGFGCEAVSSENTLSATVKQAVTTSAIAVTADTSAKGAITDEKFMSTSENYKENILNSIIPVTTDLLVNSSFASTTGQNDIATETPDGKVISWQLIWALIGTIVGVGVGVVVFVRWIVKRLKKKTNRNSPHFMEKLSFKVLNQKGDGGSDSTAGERVSKPCDQTQLINSNREDSMQPVQGENRTIASESTCLASEQVESEADESAPLNSSEPFAGDNQSGRDGKQIKLSKDEVERRNKVFKNMASIITVKDLCCVGRELLQNKGREFEDTFNDKLERRENAIRIFNRAVELNPDLSLEDLHKVVTDFELGYLQQIIEAEM